MTDPKEVVLPSGRFAKIRGLTGKDYLEAAKPENKNLNMAFLFVTLSVTIDEQPVTYREMEEMDLRDVMAILPEINKFFSGPITL